jgi:hypothetical protein
VEAAVHHGKRPSGRKTFNHLNTLEFKLIRVDVARVASRNFYPSTGFLRPRILPRR